jgi:hypothetical protein
MLFMENKADQRKPKLDTDTVVSPGSRFGPADPATPPGSAASARTDHWWGRGSVDVEIIHHRSSVRVR